ncbi:MAG: hypothetical protein R3E89_15845 [Thiolinea sp.]
MNTYPLSRQCLSAIAPRVWKRFYRHSMTRYLRHQETAQCLDKLRALSLLLQQELADSLELRVCSFEWHDRAVREQSHVSRTLLETALLQVSLHAMPHGTRLAM